MQVPAGTGPHDIQIQFITGSYRSLTIRQQRFQWYGKLKFPSVFFLSVHDFCRKRNLSITDNTIDLFMKIICNDSVRCDHNMMKRVTYRFSDKDLNTVQPRIIFRFHMFRRCTGFAIRKIKILMVMSDPEFSLCRILFSEQRLKIPDAFLTTRVYLVTSF